jgi:hypothetical protein
MDNMDKLRGNKYENDHDILGGKKSYCISS